MGANAMKKRYTTILAVLLLAGVFLVAAFQRGAIAEAWTLATTKKTDTFTALSFADTGKLPTYSPPGKPQTITFQITNHEAAAQTYEYVALLSIGDKTSVLDKGAMTIPVGQTADRTLNYTLPDPDMSAHIIVQLTGRTEYISFGTKS